MSIKPKKQGGQRPGAGRPPNATRMTLQHLNILAKLDDLNYDPITEMVAMATDLTLDASLRASIHKELAQYIAPKRKTVDVGLGDGSNEIQITVKRYQDGDNTTLQLGPPKVPTELVELSRLGGKESSISLASPSGEGSDDDKLGSESSGGPAGSILACIPDV